MHYASGESNDRRHLQKQANETRSNRGETLSSETESEVVDNHSVHTKLSVNTHEHTLE